MTCNSHVLAEIIAAQFAKLPEVEAIALGGSLAAGRADGQSDIDLHVYCQAPLAVEARALIIGARASRMELDNDFWGETEDYWLERESSAKVEAVYRGEGVMTTIAEMFANNRARLGTSTTLWHSVKTSEVLYDRGGWFASLRQLADMPYPATLADAIIHKNATVLRGSLANLPDQLAQTVKRGDITGVHHFISVILDSYFDVLFALNRTPHPGTKRMLAYAKELEQKPKGMLEDVTDLVNHGDLTQVINKVDQLINRLLALLSDRTSTV